MVTGRSKTKELGEKHVPPNPTWIDPGAKPGFRGKRPATNSLIHGTASNKIRETSKWRQWPGPGWSAVENKSPNTINDPACIIFI
jgi:hypothetical protein